MVYTGKIKSYIEIWELTYSREDGVGSLHGIVQKWSNLKVNLTKEHPKVPYGSRK